MKVSNAPGPSSTVTMKTTNKADVKAAFAWYKAKSKAERGEQLISTYAYLKDNQNPRQRNAGLFARMYGNNSLFGFAGNSAQSLSIANSLPLDRPTFNIVQSASDTLVSRISQSRPAPVFLTDNGDYKQRNLAKKLNNFIQGEFYQTKAYDKAGIILRDALVLGTGCLKVYETSDHKVGLDRTIFTELFVDEAEARDGDPRQLYQPRLMDRSVLMDAFPEYKAAIERAERAYADNSSESSKSVADLVIAVEGWRLKSGSKAKDGRHTIAIGGQTLFDEQWDKDKFPFIFLHYSPRLVGFWAQGLAEQLMSTQIEINSLLYTISKAIKLVGVPRVFVESGSKVVKAHLNNDVGAIVEYKGTKPEYVVAPCVPEELYAQLQRLIDYGFQQCGVSMLQASSQKPAGLNSGEAIRSYDDISTDRFQALSRRYDNVFVDLAYLILDQAIDIAREQGEYQTVYPNKNGAKEIDLPDIDMLEDPFVIQVFNMSSLPKDPAGRLQKITEMIQAGMITLKEGRRLLDYPDLDQVEKLANASEERIYQILDEIIEDGKYTPPDPFMTLDFAKDTVVQYINLYTSAKLEEEKAQMLRDFYTQVGTLMQAAMPPAQPPMGAPAPQAAPEATPTSPLVPNAPGAAAA